MSTPTLGAGICPGGSSAGGYGVPATGDALVLRVFKKADGTQGDAALLDTTTGDYVLDSTGQKIGWSSLDQMVFLSLRTTLGSAADPTLGIVPIGGVVTADLAQRSEAAVRAALKRMTDGGLITVVSVTTTFISPTAIQRTTFWKDKSSGTVKSTVI